MKGAGMSISYCLEVVCTVQVPATDFNMLFPAQVIVILCSMCENSYVWEV